MARFHFFFRERLETALGTPAAVSKSVLDRAAGV